MSLSVVIPCYEMNGNGARFLSQLLQTIDKQTIKSKVEIVVSDDSKDESIYNVCKKYNKLKIKYVKNKSKINNFSSNCNNGIKNSENDYIKPMCQDDFFVREDALEIFLNNKSGWCASGCMHYSEEEKKFYNPLTPYYQDDILRGVNTISSPSSIAFLRDDSVLFDDNLSWFMDCELYYRLQQREEIRIIQEILIGNRCWSGQVTNTLITDELVVREKNYINKKYEKTIFV
jgi:glycosyltransferase involved in cell wall biosynthesis